MKARTSALIAVLLVTGRAVIAFAQASPTPTPAPSPCANATLFCYAVTIDTSALAGSAGGIAFDVTTENPGFNNREYIINFTTDGVTGLPQTQGGLVDGDIILKLNPAPSTSIANGSFFNQLLLPLTSFGTTISFGLELTSTATPPSPDEFSFYVVDSHGFPLLPTSDPLAVDSLFTVDIDGSPNGVLNTFTPGMFTAPNAINVSLIPPTTSSPVTVTSIANSTGSSGETVSAGAFSVSNPFTSTLTINSMTIIPSAPNLLISLSVSAPFGDQVSSGTATASSSTVVSLTPPLEIAAGASASFTVNATIASVGQQLSSTQSLTQLSGMDADGGVAFGGLPGNLGMVTGVASTPPPVTGSLSITPKKLNFGTVGVGHSETKTVTIKNAGQITKKKSPSPILIQMESTDNAVFTIAMSCTDDQLNPKAKGQKAGACTVKVNFTPTNAVKYSGNLDILDNLEPGLKNTVPIIGQGKIPKISK
jgi:hypothetical protein